MAEFKDFDEAVKADEPLQIKVAGRAYELSPTLPARVVLTQMRHSADGANIPFEVIPEWIEALVGPDDFAQMMEDGITWNQMQEVLNYLLEFYGLNGEQEPAEDGDEEAPK